MLDRYADMLEELGKNVQSRELNDKVLIVDGLNTFIRVFSVIPIMNDNGEHIGGISGFLKAIGYSIKMFNPTRVVLVFDGKGGSSKRKKTFSGYKGNRVNKTTLNRFEGFRNVEDEEASMRHQMYRLGLYLKNLPVSIVTVDNIEADDAIAYLAEEYFQKKVIIYSTDKDFLQLINEDISVWSPQKKKHYNEEALVEELGVHPVNYYFYKIIMGDTGDNVPGIKGIGPKTLLKLFPELVEDRPISLREIKDKVDSNQGINSMKKIGENWDIVERNNSLMTLTEFDFSGLLKAKIIDLVEITLDRINTPEIKKLFLEDRLYSGIPDIDSWLRTTFIKLEH